MKTKALWDVAPSSLVEADRRFRGGYCLHHQGDESLSHRPDDGACTRLHRAVSHKASRLRQLSASLSTAIITFSHLT
jgi:hypothetical protein